MVPNFSQYSPQGLASQFPGLQGAGWPQMNPGLFGQPGIGGGNVSFGQDSGQPGLGQQVPFGAQTNSSAQTPFTQNPFVQNPFVIQPNQQNPLLQGSFAHNPAQHLVTVLGQLALQLAAHGAVTQQIGIALHQLAQQLGAQSLQGHPSGQYFGQNPFAGAIQGYGQGGYSGFNPQGQAWGTNRPQTIQ